ncbi:ATP-binding cassette domain-containing protein [Pradoshia sp. D12]|uniref:ABC transporter ATP-binding protein n=1 Tax=Bacillaceae TaxID=186817 RepID=UPI00112A89E2|nr:MULTISPECIES: oligopeptide/dipeptide ABC transporter ATP-binding protein [Bacillaceae]QFK71397.1 ATP-binding cassette domain-containing protein [Pradoshia sp. D12]TPF73192.1 ATP-binding cassette domain-containing protein [Bacillus sp. D12]
MQQNDNTKDILLTVNNLEKYFKDESLGKKVIVKAVNNITLCIERGETYGLVGESGCGKSTAGRTILNLIRPTNGDVVFKGINLSSLSQRNMRKYRKMLQMIFQDPYSSLNPRKRIGKSLEEPLAIHNVGAKSERIEKVIKVLKSVGMGPESLYKFPHEFSGGQLQRIGIARALICEPELIICDEPVSALDVSVQAQIINLLIELQKQLQLTYIFIAHDLSVVRHISDRVGVMYFGSLIEEAVTDDIYNNPLHPYTQTLLSAVPSVDPKTKSERIEVLGEPPSPLNPPLGCPFHTRCPKVMDICKHHLPKRIEVESAHFVNCHLY